MRIPGCLAKGGCRRDAATSQTIDRPCCWAVIAWALGGPAAPAATLHVVIAADRAAPGIGPDMEVGRQAIVARR